MLLRSRSASRLPAFALVVIASCGPPAPAHPAPSDVPELKAFSAPLGIELDMACVAAGPETCFDAIDNNCNDAIDEGCGVRTGVVQFSIAWSDPAADIDLVVTDPAGAPAKLDDPTELGLLKDRDCPGDGEACHGQNTENVFLVTKLVPRGRFRVLVRFTRLGDLQPPLTVRLGARLGQKSYSSVLTLDAVGDQRLLVFEL